ncbi:MAG: cytochrome c-type biogenesis protein CcmH [Actinobacteria bacterium]|nr:cytochrome c-type biogenesis protein CcmH [Actinomycetota bacterium]MCI0677499.1 cytochrome c-type biogenesis protein CcmH [Actinomycetota bacterium]
MSERGRNTITLATMTILAVLIVFLVATNPSEDDRVARLGSAIMCPVCQGESIAQSPAPMARDMMDLIEERVAAGASDAEIVDEILSSFSGAVLLDPPVSGPTIVLWAAPVAALLLGLMVIWWWRRAPVTSGEETPTRPVRTRTAVTALATIAVLIVIVVIAGFFLRERTDGLSGVAGLEVESLDEVSNATMEAVIVANQDDPAIDGMRLALAERYFTSGDYQAAFPHFLAVAESEAASASQVVTALIGLGWMAWDGNGEAETALGLLDQALSIDVDSITARYLKGRVLWCGLGDASAAEDLFTALLSSPGLDAESRVLIEEDLTALSEGEPCR